MSNRPDAELIRDIREAVERVAKYVGGMSYETFVADTKTQDAVIRNLEIVGEATKRLSGQVRAEHSDIPWRQMAGSRDRLIHDYFGVNLDIVWRIVDVELPRLSSNLKKIAPEKEGG